VSEFLHLSLRSRDRDRTSEWYQKNLGFEEQRRGTTAIGTQTAILVHPSSKTYIEVSDRAKLGHDFEIPEEAIMLRFTVPDMRAAYDRFKANGANVTEGDPSSEYIFLEDADGYEVEVSPGEGEAKFDSIGLRVTDLDKSVQFYKEHLGFQERRRWTTPRGTNIVILELPGNPTTLSLRQMPFLTSSLEVPENLMHLAFPVPDMQRFRQEMAAKGVEADPDGDRMSWVLDPDGYEWEMIERRP
jgi:catechol 2,3-dioxygenase-like lactoylglutathione lyase family enzyme